MKPTVHEMRNMSLPALDAYVSRLEDDLETAKAVRVQVAETIVKRAQEILDEREFRVGDRVRVLEGSGIDNYIGNVYTLTEILSESYSPYRPAHIYGIPSDVGDWTVYASKVEVVR